MSQGIQRIMMRAFVGLGLLLAFTLAVVSCGSGLMPSMPAMHSEGTECTGMFINECAISQKGLGVSLAMILLATFIFLLSVWVAMLADRLSSDLHMGWCLFIRWTKLLRSRGYILQQFSQGILHPQIY